MKRSVLIFLVFAMLVCLFSCGSKKSEAVVAAEKAIEAIGEVTIDSGEDIKNAEKLYGILTENEKSEVSNRLKLIEAREEYDNLFAKLMFENSATAFSKIERAATLCIDGMNDIYEAWRFGIYDAEDTGVYSIFYKLSSETSFSEDEIEQAAEDSNIDASYCVNGFLGTSAWNYCLWVIDAAHENRGTFTQISTLLKDAEALLKDIGDNYSDFEHYPSLKKYYSEVSSYADFFENYSCSFEQLKTIITDYENTIRTLNSDLKFVFEGHYTDLDEESNFEANL